MKVLVYDVAAQDGGGLQVLKDFYADAVRCPRKDIHWIFLVSADVLEEMPGIEVRLYQKVKKSWLHRLIFEYLELPGIIRQLAPELVISLQNMPVKGCRVRQFVYLHQSLQFCPKSFSFFKSEERALAIRQHLIGWLIRNAMPKAEHIFVQTRWVKDATRKWLHRPEKDITVVPVTVRKDVPLRKYKDPEQAVFFYPARGEVYKNHHVILDACRRLAAEGITDYQVIFTMTLEDGACARRLYQEARGLPVAFVGTVPYERIWDHYSCSILLFPSYLETCGLPLLEAKLAGSRILASDLPFAHEALDGYPNARFFKHDDSAGLAEQMKLLVAGNLPYRQPEDISDEAQSGLLDAMLRRI